MLEDALTLSHTSQFRGRDWQTGARDVPVECKGIHVLLNERYPTARSQARYDVLNVRTSDWNGRVRVHWCVDTNKTISQLRRNNIHPRACEEAEGPLCHLLAYEIVNNLLRSNEFKQSVARRIKYTVLKTAKLEKERQTNKFYEGCIFPVSHMRKYWATRVKQYYQRILVFGQLKMMVS
jgi:hypothetical protein